MCFFADNLKNSLIFICPQCLYRRTKVSLYSLYRPLSAKKYSICRLRPQQKNGVPFRKPHFKNLIFYNCAGRVPRSLTKQSLQRTGRSLRGTKGTSVSCAHCAQVTFVNWRFDRRSCFFLSLQTPHRFGAEKPLSA